MFCINERYENLEVYALSYQTTLEIYRITDFFPEHERSVLGSQLRRAAISVPLNISEGSAGSSYRVFLNFLSYSYRSARELFVGLQIAHDTRLVSDSDFVLLNELVDKLVRKLYCYMEFVEKRAGPSNRERSFEKTEQYWGLVAERSRNNVCSS